MRFTPQKKGNLSLQSLGVWLWRDGQTDEETEPGASLEVQLQNRGSAAPPPYISTASLGWRKKRGEVCTPSGSFEGPGGGGTSALGRGGGGEGGGARGGRERVFARHRLRWHTTGMSSAEQDACPHLTSSVLVSFCVVILLAGHRFWRKSKLQKKNKIKKKVNKSSIVNFLQIHACC